MRLDFIISWLFWSWLLIDWLIVDFQQSSSLITRCWKSWRRVTMGTPTCSTIWTKCSMRVSMQRGCSLRYSVISLRYSVMAMMKKTLSRNIMFFFRLSLKFYCRRTRRRQRRRGSRCARRRSPAGTRKTTSCLENWTFGSGVISGYLGDHHQHSGSGSLRRLLGSWVVTLSFMFGTSSSCTTGPRLSSQLVVTMMTMMITMSMIMIIMIVMMTNQDIFVRLCLSFLGLLRPWLLKATNHAEVISSYTKIWLVLPDIPDFIIYQTWYTRYTRYNIYTKHSSSDIPDTIYIRYMMIYQACLGDI